LPLVVEPSWVGRRVSVRRVLDHAADGRAQFGDVVGDLVGLGAQAAVVDTRTGLIEVPVADISMARLVPPSTADELALEAVAARGLRPAETLDLDGWLLRADSGFTRRANSALPLGRPARPLVEALGAAHAWYAERGLPLRIQVPLEGRRLLDAELGERGWEPTALTQLFVARVDALQTAEPTGSLPPVEIADQPDDEWLTLYRDGGGLSEAGRALLVRHDRVAFASVRIGGRVVAVGRGAVDDGWVGVMAVEVAPDHRRQGLAQAVMTKLCRWAATTHGATRSYLSVLADNTPAVALYERLGFWVHHEYHYRVEPAAAPPAA
jgi:ribosomal protein S18 acetylase RimI-like enzyme